MKLSSIWLVRDPDPLVLCDDPALTSPEVVLAQFCNELGVENEELFRVFFGTTFNDPERWENEKTVLYTEEAEAKKDANKRLAKLQKKFTGVKCPTCKGRGTVGEYPNGEWDRCPDCGGSGHVRHSV